MSRDIDYIQIQLASPKEIERCHKFFLIKL